MHRYRYRYIIKNGNVLSSHARRSRTLGVDGSWSRLTVAGILTRVTPAALRSTSCE